MKDPRGFMKILVAYCTKTGSTEEVAKRIGAILAEKSHDVNVMPISSVLDPAGCDMLVLGAPINGMKVLPEFRSFIETRVAGRGIETNLFILSYVYPKGRTFWKNAVAKDVEQIRQLAGAKSAVIFGGKISERMPGLMNFAFGLSKSQPLDLRDWSSIEAWAENL